MNLHKFISKTDLKREQNRKSMWVSVMNKPDFIDYFMEMNAIRFAILTIYQPTQIRIYWFLLRAKHSRELFLRTAQKFNKTNFSSLFSQKI